MSYESESELPNGTSLESLTEVVKLLGYEVVKDGLKIPSRVGCYFWADQSDYKSWTGVELNIYRENRAIKVTTRSRISRSFWDLKHQNKTIKTVQNLFGGRFETDEGRNRYLHPSASPPSPLSSGCYLARWKFHNALQKADIYLMSRRLEGEIASENPTGFFFLDEMNPRLLSNNFLIPFVIAVWEEYFRATFAAVLCYADKRESVLKNARLSHVQLELIATEKQQVERTLAECFSFQRPSAIDRNFKLIDMKIDIAGRLRKPYRRRKTSLYDSIEAVVESRNAFVHEGNLDLSLYDKELTAILNDVVVAVDRVYEAIGAHFDFTPLRDY